LPDIIEDMKDKKFTHVDSGGNIRMVDVSEKDDTSRTAVAKGEIRISPETLELIEKHKLSKGDVLGVAQVAGITGGKRTADLIPLCHPLSLTHLSVELEIKPELPGIEIKATGKTRGKTGVEMEVLTAVSIAALTVYDMVKSAEKSIHIQNIRLVSKQGGKSGDVDYE
jgi:cyclic pyranopterin phosphate synthase